MDAEDDKSNTAKRGRSKKVEALEEEEDDEEDSDSESQEKVGIGQSRNRRFKTIQKT